MCGKAAKVRISEQQQSVLKNRRRRVFGQKARHTGAINVASRESSQPRTESNQLRLSNLGDVGQRISRYDHAVGAGNRRVT